jgi:hypothetical protein
MYMGRDGRQYVAVAAGVGFHRDPTSNTLIAYALPKATNLTGDRK